MLSDLLGRQKANEIMVEIEDLIENIQSLGWKEVRPWSEFFATFKPPQQWNKQHLEERITTNFLHYRSNYFLLCIFLFIIQLIFSPIIIFTAIIIALLYIGLFSFVKNNTRIGDIIITFKIKQYIFLISTGLLLILSGSLTRLAWIFISSIFVCGGHMVFRPRNMTAKANKVYEEMKLNGYDINSIFHFSSSSGSVAGAASSSTSSSNKANKDNTYNNDKPSYANSGKKDLEDPPNEDDIPASTPYSSTPAGYSSNLQDTSGNMRKRGPGDYDYKNHK
mmetsp:Transcript_9589/g.10314  ORF Transcript_9589/g.10314 Transcript_9589/m.10314 type:complete len:278 (-) Transcript_9589:146-979(-)